MVHGRPLEARRCRETGVLFSGVLLGHLVKGVTRKATCLTPPNAIEMGFCPNDQVVIDDSRRGHAAGIKFVFRKQFKAFRVGLEDNKSTIFIARVETTARLDQ